MKDTVNISPDNSDIGFGEWDHAGVGFAFIDVLKVPL